MRRALHAIAVASVLTLLLAVAPAGAQDDLSAEFRPDAVTAGSNATLHVDGVGGETVSVTSPQLSNDEIARVLGGTATTDSGTLVEIPADGNVTATFDGFACRPGRYTFRVHHDGATADATVEVLATAEAKTTFERTVVRVASGRTAEVAVRTRCSDTDARVVLAGEGYAASVDLSLDGPGTATLLVDTGAVGDGDPATTFAVEGAGALANVTVRRDAGDPPLATGEYDLSLSVDGEETDVATLEVTGGTPTPTASPAPTDTPTSRVTGTDSLTPSPTGSAEPTVSVTPVPSVTATGAPGFGPAAVLVALLAVAASRS